VERIIPFSSTSSLSVADTKSLVSVHFSQHHLIALILIRYLCEKSSTVELPEYLFPVQIKSNDCGCAAGPEPSKKVANTIKNKTRICLLLDSQVENLLSHSIAAKTDLSKNSHPHHRCLPISPTPTRTPAAERPGFMICYNGAIATPIPKRPRAGQIRPAPRRLPPQGPPSQRIKARP
jgi:hypothetical protein